MHFGVGRLVAAVSYLTMRRALAILKYVPAVLCGLLVVAWGASVFFPIGLSKDYQNSETFVGVRFGNVEFSRTNSISSFLYPAGKPPTGPTVLVDLHDQFLGRWSWCWAGDDMFEYCVPILILSTALALAAVAPLTRLPLWSYFAWTALVGAELAFYLR